MGGTRFHKIWDVHVVGRRIDGRELLCIDPDVLHELYAPHAFKKLKMAGTPASGPICQPERTYGGNFFQA
jgi:3-isopropylmalate/(R)-2-methylmalate dehydratase large subunit